MSGFCIEQMQFIDQWFKAEVVSILYAGQYVASDYRSWHSDTF